MLLIESDIGSLDDRCKSRQIRFHQREKLVRRGYEGIHPLTGQFLPRIGQGDNTSDFDR